MKKTFFIMIFIFWIFSLFSNEVSIEWNKPMLTSDSNTSFLFEQSETIESWKQYDNVENNFYCAVNSWQNFKQAWKMFLTYREDDHNFLQYKTKNSFKTVKQKIVNSGLSSSLQSPGIPRNSAFSFELYSGLDFISDTEDNYYFFYYGTYFSGSVNNRLRFYSNWWKGHFSLDQDYAHTSYLIDSWTQSNSDSTETYLDNITGRLQYSIAPWWDLSIGRSKYEIGSNIGGSIILSDECNDYGYLSTKFEFKDFSISMLHATLVADSTNDGKKKFPNKYLATHKLDWHPSDRFNYFLGEHVMYGDRSIDANYLIPIGFWRITEHNLSDRDNVLIYTGFNWIPKDQQLVYSNFIIDELSVGELLNNWWGNKYAVQTGYSYDLKKNRRISIEFTAIRPWLYTHKYIHTKFSQDDRSLGFPDGSNLIQFASEFEYSILDNLQINLHGSFTRQGSVGNDFSINYETRDKELDEDTHWLEGEITNNILGRFVCNWSPLAHHRIKLAFIIQKTADDDWSKEVTIGYQARY
ncbi:MAG: hypothetical protein B1H06_03595 [Candidatus Cloacimonas sp. 4484_143]|nr:MAG: hypothetical protein B1H06_03595 [Candidatus Cloacimonas sp. 4484_143]RLC55493.1 MAG: hypothetical protein DRH89_07590 [Candidatus Cloacimonadota bacterium]